MLSRTFARLERSVPARWRVDPDFLIIGTMKGGTTTLYETLRRHPEVASAETKEIHFFDDHWGEGTPWYRRHFQSVFRRAAGRRRGRSFVTGEATPRYLFSPKVPARVAETLPGARFVALLRDPTRRAYSHYQHNRRHDREPRPFAEAVDTEIAGHAAGQARVKPSYLARGLYAEQLERWWSHFPRERFLIRTSEEFFADGPAVLGDVCAHLDLAPFDWAGSGEADRAYNRHPYSPADAATLDRLRDWFRPHVARLEALLDRPLGWS